LFFLIFSKLNSYKITEISILESLEKNLQKYTSKEIKTNSTQFEKSLTSLTEQIGVINTKIFDFDKFLVRICKKIIYIL